MKMNLQNLPPNFITHKTILQAVKVVSRVALAIFIIFNYADVSAQSRGGEPVKLKVLNVGYNYSLAPQGNNTYGPGNMVDGNPATVWAVSLNNTAIYDYNSDGEPTWIWGPWFEVPCKKLSHIIIRNGYGKNTTAYVNNSRASYICIETEGDGELGGFEAILKDDPAPQRLNAPLNADWNYNINIIQIAFESDGGIIEGQKWNDLCISEIEFWGWKQSKVQHTYTPHGAQNCVPCGFIAQDRMFTVYVLLTYDTHFSHPRRARTERMTFFYIIHYRHLQKSFEFCK